MREPDDDEGSNPHDGDVPRQPRRGSPSSGYRPHDSRRNNDVSRLSRTCDESRLVVTQQIAAVRQIDRKAIKILRANILLLGLVFTALSILVRTDVDPGQFINLHVVIGGLALFISAFFAATTYLVTEVETGVGATAVRRSADGDLTETEFHRKLAKGYANWISHNESAIRVNALFASLMVISVVNGLTFLVSGAIVGALDLSFTTLSLISAIILVIVMALISVFLYKVDLWVRIHNSIDSDP